MRAANDSETRLFAIVARVLQETRPRVRRGRLERINLPVGTVERTHNGGLRVRDRTTRFTSNGGRTRPVEPDELARWRGVVTTLGLSPQVIGDWTLVRLTVGGRILKRTPEGRIVVLETASVSYAPTDDVTTALVEQEPVAPEYGGASFRDDDDGPEEPESSDPRIKFHFSVARVGSGRTASNADGLVALKGDAHAPGNIKKARERLRLTRRQCPLCKGSLYNPPHVHRIISASQVTRGGPIRDLRGRTQSRFGFGAPRQVELDVGTRSVVTKPDEDSDE